MDIDFLHFISSRKRYSAEHLALRHWIKHGWILDMQGCSTAKNFSLGDTEQASVVLVLSFIQRKQAVILSAEN